MTLALICLDGYRVAEALDAAAATLNPSLAWLLLHVADARPAEELARALERLPGRGLVREQAAAKVRHVVEWSEADVRAAVAAWEAARGRSAELLVTSGRPEREIIRVAEERGVALIALGVGRNLPGRSPGPGPFLLSPVARYVIDHARRDVLLLRRYIGEADRRG
jgi:nucleotide-binding universal stress UspA family protein